MQIGNVIADRDRVHEHFGRSADRVGLAAAELRPAARLQNADAAPSSLLAPPAADQDLPPPHLQLHLGRRGGLQVRLADCVVPLQSVSHRHNDPGKHRKTTNPVGAIFLLRGSFRWRGINFYDTPVFVFGSAFNVFGSVGKESSGRNFMTLLFLLILLEQKLIICRANFLNCSFPIAYNFCANILNEENILETFKNMKLTFKTQNFHISF